MSEISHQERPNFDFAGQKGLHVRWGMYKREKCAFRPSQRELTLVRLLTCVYRPFDFPPDQRQIFRHEEFLEAWS